MFFKEIVHANKFRREVNERFERATLPDVPEERLKELLSFVVIGAGPTGVELAAELYDMVYEDVPRCTRRACSPLCPSRLSTCRRRSSPRMIAASPSTRRISSSARTSNAC